MKYLHLLILVTTLCLAQLSSGKKKKNFVFIITDDQDNLPYTISVMTKLKALIADKGALFTNSFVNNPVCCPSRAGTFLGQHMHNHKVINNSMEGNCGSEHWVNLEKNLFPVLMNKKGYTTFYAGKYMNNYADGQPGDYYVPPGWNWWYVNKASTVFFNYFYSDNGTQAYRGNTTDDYSTNFIKSNAVNFINQQDKNKEFFMVIAPNSPHYPFTPEEKYKNHFNNVITPRTPNFNIANENKNWFLQYGTQPLIPSVVNLVDYCYASRLKTLLSIDDMIESVIQTLENRGLLDDTYVIFTSDHGYHTGQFSLPLEKGTPYEFDIRVPLLVRGPGISEGKVINYPTLNSDLGPTILDLAGIKAPKTMDGVSVKRFLLDNPQNPGRSVLIEHVGINNIPQHPNDCDREGMGSCLTQFDCKCSDCGNNTYSCIRTLNDRTNEVYCEWEYGFKEYYNIEKDPYQVTNTYESLFPLKQLTLQSDLNDLRYCSGSSCLNEY